MAKSKIGPFALEAPLSIGKGSGQLFRAVHLEQRKLAAIRVFPLPMGLTPESREAFASQLEQLKQLRHPSIARCYGGGFDTRNAYLAYELVDGESLAQSLERRQRLPWETALDLSQQLAEGLQYAHQMGWIHGRLSTSKILINQEGRAKLSDFRRDAIHLMIGNNQADLQQSLFAPPEAFQHRPPDEKWDLYSLGALMYAMLTGNPPFASDNIQELANRIASEPPPQVSATVLDCPVWLNAIVDQLLSKDPRQRPFSATALQLAFKEAQRRQAEGVGVLQHATAGFSPLQLLKVDRAEAEKVLGVKKTKKKKGRDEESSFFEKPSVLVTALALALSAVVWFLLPLSESALRARAEKNLQSKEWLDWNYARDAYLTQMLERFPDGNHAEWAQEQIDWINMQEAERRIERNQRLGRKPPPEAEAERRYVEAKEFEDFGDRATALDKYRAIINILSDNEEDRSIINLARRQIRAIESNPLEANYLQKLLTTKLDEANQAYEKGDTIRSKRIWESILNLYRGNQELAPLVDQAQEKIDQMKSSSK